MDQDQVAKAYKHHEIREDKGGSHVYLYTSDQQNEEGKRRD